MESIHQIPMLQKFLFESGKVVHEILDSNTDLSPINWPNLITIIGYEKQNGIGLEKTNNKRDHTLEKLSWCNLKE